MELSQLEQDLSANLPISKCVSQTILALILDSYQYYEHCCLIPKCMVMESFAGDAPYYKILLLVVWLRRCPSSSMKPSVKGRLLKDLAAGNISCKWAPFVHKKLLVLCLYFLCIHFYIIILLYISFCQCPPKKPISVPPLKSWKLSGTSWWKMPPVGINWILAHTKLLEDGITCATIYSGGPVCLPNICTY